jgi:hypothetical protein
MTRRTGNVQMGLKVGVAGVTLSGLLLAAAACGGTGGTDANSAAASGGPGGAFQAYTACLAKNGVTLPSAAARVRGSGRPSGQPTGQPTDRPTARPSRFPGGGGFGGGGFGFGSAAPSGVDQAAWDKAQKECASLRPSTGPNGGGFGGRDNGAITAYRNCLSDHGVTLPAGGNNRLNQLSSADPKTDEAIKACEPLRPTGQPGRQPNPSST